MSAWTIFGELIQPGIGLQPPVNIQGAIESDALGRMPYHLLMADADVVVTFDASTDANAYTLRNIAEDVAQRWCDVFALTNGMGLRVQMRSASTPAGTLVFSRKLARVTGSDATTKAAEHAFQIMYGAKHPAAQEALRVSLADYRQALTEPGETVALCWRAVESLAYYFGRNNDKGMDALASSLLVSRRWLRRTLDVPAQERRHGKAGWVTEDQRVDALLAARLVIERFLLFLEHDLQLPPGTEKIPATEAAEAQGA